MNIIRTIAISLTLLTAPMSAALAQQANFDVVPDSQEGIYRLSYLSQEATPLTVSIVDDEGTLVHREYLHRRSEVNRAYRLREINAGTYSFQVATPAGTLSRQVTYPIVSVTDAFDVDLLADPEGSRYQLQLTGAPSHHVRVRIYDQAGQLLYDQRSTVAEQDNQIYNLAKVDARSVIFSVSDDEQTVARQVSLR
jgi:hypothetical protein